MPLKISDFCLIVSNVDRAVTFYRDQVGLPMRFRNENFADFDLGGGARLALWEAAHVGQVVGAPALGAPGNRFMGAMNFDSGAAVDTAYAELIGRGIHFIQELQDWPWGARAAYFADPDGYLWEIYAWVQKPRTLADVATAE